MTDPAVGRCVVCNGRQRRSAERFDVERAWRWIITTLQDDQAASAMLASLQQEIDDCPDCLRVVAGGLAAIAAGVIRSRTSRWIALRTAQQALDKLQSSPA